MSALTACEFSRRRLTASLLHFPSACSSGGAGTSPPASGHGGAAAPAAPATFAEKYKAAEGLRAANAAVFASRTPAAAPWCGPLALTPIEDVFNDNLNYDADRWPKLEALNAGMLPVMRKFRMLYPECPDVIAATAAFLDNYQVIADALVAAASTISSSGCSGTGSAVAATGTGAGQTQLRRMSPAALRATPLRPPPLQAALLRRPRSRASPLPLPPAAAIAGRPHPPLCPQPWRSWA